MTAAPDEMPEPLAAIGSQEVLAVLTDDLIERLNDVAGEWEKACKAQGDHDICECCSESVLLREAESALREAQQENARLRSWMRSHAQHEFVCTEGNGCVCGLAALSDPAGEPE